MNNVIIFLIELAVVFSALTVCHRLFGKVGVMVWVPVAIILANLLTAKQAAVFGIGTSLGTVWFASTFLATDILTEFYSAQDARKAVLLGVFGNILFIIAPQITLAYIPAAYDFADGAMRELFALNLRISIASMVMYLIANIMDIYIYDRIRQRMNNRAMFVRNNVATIITNCLENFGFIALAFGGIYDLKTVIQIAAGTSIVEMIAALLDTPFLYISARFKHKENTWAEKANGRAI